MEKDKKKKRIVRAIHFDEGTYVDLERGAKEQGLPFATYVKSAALNFTKNAILHEQLLSSINAQDQAAAQKTFNDTIGELRDVLSHTIVNSSEQLNKKLDTLEKLIRLMIYAQLYYTREIPQDQRGAAQISAKNRMRQLLKAIDGESQER